jgi:uncharacterized protein (TIGR04222 family)
MPMTPEQITLHDKIQAFELDQVGAVRGFTQKLAKENHWSAEFTQRAIAEYKRFIFLAMMAGHTVVPSEEIDRVWHLHLTYTKSYWEEFCGEVLGKPLHHSPSQGSQQEFTQFVDLYRQTLASYQQFFDRPAPEDLWPAPELRFGQVAPELQDVWVLPKPSWLKNGQWSQWFMAMPTRWLLGTIVFGIGFCCIDAIAWATTGTINPLNLPGTNFLNFYWQFASVAVATAIILRWEYGDPTPSNLSTDLNPYEIAYLAAQGRRTINVGIVKLLTQDNLRINEDEQSLVLGQPLNQTANELEQAIVTCVAEADATVGRTIRTLYKELIQAGEVWRRSLQERALYFSSEDFTRWQMITILPMIVALLVGLAKVLIGLSWHRPIGYLIGLCVALLLVIVAVSPHPDEGMLWTRSGRNLLRSLQNRYQLLNQAPGQGDTLLLAIALFGLRPLQSSDEHAALQTLFGTVNQAAYFGDSSSGCGTGGCSSGCGSSCGSGCGGGCGGCS